MKKIFYVLLFCGEYVTGSALPVVKHPMTEEQCALNGDLFFAVDKGDIEKINQVVRAGALIHSHLIHITVEQIMTFPNTRWELLKSGINKEIDSPIFDLIGDFLYQTQDKRVESIS